jgi:1,4-dihydroxy-2-naphthoate octaprenyltransferase
MATFNAILGVIRAPFLILPVTLVASGAAAAAYDGAFRWSRTLVALVGLVALHVAVNVLNEVSDMRTGIDLRTERTPFSGGSGTLPAGRMAEPTARWIGYGAFALGAACGIWFLYEVGWSLAPLFVVGAVCVLAYTDLLARLCVGECAAGLGLGALSVVGAAMVQGGTLGAAALAVSIPAFLMTFNLLLLNEFPDEVADRQGGRRNLVIVFGRKAAARLYAVAALLTPLSILAGVAFTALPTVCTVGALPSLLLIPAFRWAFGNTERPLPLPALGANVIWNLSTNATLAAALAFAVLRGAH